MKNTINFFLVLITCVIFKTQAQTLTFTENKGQLADQNGVSQPGIFYYGENQGLAFYLKNNGVSYQLNKVDATKKNSINGQSPSETPGAITVYRIDIEWPGVKETAYWQTGQELEGFQHFYTAASPDGINFVKSFGDIFYRGLYNNIDLHYYKSGNNLKYDYLVHPGANINDIRLHVKGASKITCQQDGSLLIFSGLIPRSSASFFSH